MNKTFISHSNLPLPKEAVSVSIEMIDKQMLSIMTADHSPISYSSIKETGLWMTEHAIYARITKAEDENCYYRVMIQFT